MSKSRYSSAHFLSIASASPDWQGKGVRTHERANRTVRTRHEASFKRRLQPGRDQLGDWSRSGIRDSGISMCSSEEKKHVARAYTMQSADYLAHQNYTSDANSEYPVIIRSTPNHNYRDRGLRITDDSLPLGPANSQSDISEVVSESMYHTMVNETSKKKTDANIQVHIPQSNLRQANIVRNKPERESSTETLKAFSSKDQQNTIEHTAAKEWTQGISPETKTLTPSTPQQPLSSRGSVFEAVDEYSMVAPQLEDNTLNASSPSSAKCSSILSSATTCVSAESSQPTIPLQRCSHIAANSQRFDGPASIDIVTASTDNTTPASNKQITGDEPRSSIPKPAASSSWFLTASPPEQGSPFTSNVSHASPIISTSSHKQNIMAVQSPNFANIGATSTANSRQHTRTHLSIDSTNTTISRTRSESNYSYPTSAPGRSSSETDNSLRRVEYKHNNIHTTSIPVDYESTANSASLPTTPLSIATAIKISPSEQDTNIHELSHLDSDLGLRLGLGLDFDFDFDLTSDLDLAYASHLYPSGTQISKSRAPIAIHNPNLIFDAEVRSLSSSVYDSDDSDGASEIVSQYTRNDNHSRGSKPSSAITRPSTSTPHLENYGTDKFDATPPPIPISRSRPVPRLLYPAPWLLENEQSNKSSFKDKSKAKKSAIQNTNSDSATRPATLRSVFANRMGKVGFGAGNLETVNATGGDEEPHPTMRERYGQAAGSTPPSASISNVKYDWDWDHYSQSGVWKTKSNLQNNTYTSHVSAGGNNERNKYATSSHGHGSGIRKVKSRWPWAFGSGA